MRAFHRPAVAAGLVLLLQACGFRSEEAAADPRSNDGRALITAEEIRDSGAQTAWEALRRVGRVSMRETGQGEPSSMKLRGSRSLVLDETPLVVLDGVAIRDVRVLQTIRAEIIQWMEILSAVDGAAMHGPMAGGGAIVIRTKDGRGGQDQEGAAFGAGWVTKP